MKKENVKNIIKTAVFLTLLIVVIFTVQKRMIPFSAQDTNQTASFYDVPKNSVDVLVAGTSSVMVGISPLKLYEDTGIVAHVRGSSMQSPHVTYLNVKEALNYQQPKIVVVSIMSLFNDYDVDKREGMVRRGFDYKKLSFDKILVAQEIVKESEWQSLGSYILPLARYHTRYRALLEGVSDSAGEYDYLHGQYAVYKCKPITDVSDEKMKNNSDVELSSHSMVWYEKISELCQDNDIKLLFVAMPDMRWTMGKHNAIQDTAETLNADFLDYNYNDLIEQCFIECETDFYDDHHLNARGSIKATAYFGEYIQNKYNLSASNVTQEMKMQFDEDIVKFKHDLNTREYLLIGD